MSTPTSKPAWYRRHWVQLVVVGIVGLGIGGAGGSSSSADAEKRATAAEAKVTAAQKEASDANAKVTAAEAAAAAAKTDAEKALAAQKADLASQKAALDARASKVSGAEAAAKASMFDGTDGKYLVGTDIQPGTYRATASSGCYYARLSTLDESDIIENNNTDGPVLIRILSSDKAFQVSNCGEFSRIGN